MHHIVIIGAGQLGSRHLQGLMRLDLDCRYFIVDPSPRSLDVARQRAAETGLPETAERITYAETLDGLPERIDYAVVATPADVRLAVLKTLLAGRKVGNLLLEKVLFQRVGDYDEATRLIEDHGARAWVDCPRRAIPIWQQVREFFAGAGLRHAEVAGGDWGLGCNSVHFFDLFAFLTGEQVSALSTAGLDKGVFPAKRANFYEFSGSLRGRCGQTEFELTSFANSQIRRTVTLRTEGKICLVDEVGGQVFFLDESHSPSWSHQEFKLPLVSELTTVFARDILRHGRCELPTYAESVAGHVLLLQALGAHAEPMHGASPDFCPIT